MNSHTHIPLGLNGFVVIRDVSLRFSLTMINVTIFSHCLNNSKCSMRPKEWPDIHGECNSEFSFPDLTKSAFLCTQTMPWFPLSKFRLKRWGVWIHTTTFPGPVANCFSLQDRGPATDWACSTRTLRSHLWLGSGRKEELIAQRWPQDQSSIDLLASHAH